MQKLMDALRGAGIKKMAEREPMSRHTTWRIGGPADLMVWVSSAEQLSFAAREAARAGKPFKIVGKGSNLLVSDKGVRGVVARLEGEAESVRLSESGLVAGGGCSLIKLASEAAKAGLEGLEFIGGVPGTVGGAVCMNAGAHGADVAGVLEWADVVDAEGEIRRLCPEELAFGYRRSALQNERWIVARAAFALREGNKKQIAEKMAAHRAKRNATQPVQLPCAGSVFRNPENGYAAKLIEEAGMRGAKAGGAQISEKHANFIVNLGGASAKDVLSLMDAAKEAVRLKFGVVLVPEVKIFE